MSDLNGFTLIPEGNVQSEPLNVQLLWMMKTINGVMLARDQAAPTGSEDDYTLYEVSDTPTPGSEFEGHAGEMALLFPGSGWDFRAKWTHLGPLLDLGSSKRLYWDGAAWRNTKDDLVG